MIEKFDAVQEKKERNSNVLNDEESKINDQLVENPHQLRQMVNLEQNAVNLQAGNDHSPLYEVLEGFTNTLKTALLGLNSQNITINTDTQTSGTLKRRSQDNPIQDSFKAPLK